MAEIGLPEGVSLSIGVAGVGHVTPHDLVRQADLNLYEAKATLRETVDAAR